MKNSKIITIHFAGEDAMNGRLNLNNLSFILIAVMINIVEVRQPALNTGIGPNYTSEI